jgi:hypothetical protein
MSIYRGAGGSGDAVNDAASEVLLAITAKDQAIAAQTAAAASAALAAASVDGITGPTGPAGTNGVGVVVGGTANQALTKIDSTNYNTQWTTVLLPAAIGVSVQAYDANTVKSNANQTFSKLQTLTGSSSEAALKTTNIKEVITVSATAATGTINYDATTQSVLYYTTNASGNFTVNFRASSGTTLNTLMATGESMSFSFLVTNGATAYYNSALTIDGSSVTPKWQGGTAPTSGNASSIDVYNYVVIKTGSAAFSVLASQTKFA